MSMAQYETKNGDRADLAALPVAQPLGYIGGIVFPTANVFQKAGTINYQALVVDSAAQTNRVQGAAPTATVIAENTEAFTCVERIKRYIVDWTRVLSYGGVEGSDRVGAKASKRSVLNSLETEQIGVLIDAAGTDITSSIIDGIIGAAYAVRQYSGKLAFVCNQGTYRWMIQQSGVKDLLLRSFGTLTAEQAMSLSPEVFKSMLKGIFAFDEVLVGDDAFWPAAYTYTAAVCKIPDGTDPESHLIEPELGRTVVYLPEGGNQWTVNSYADKTLRSNVYDAMVFDDVEQFNSGAKSLVKLTNVVTTT